MKTEIRKQIQYLYFLKEKSFLTNYNKEELLSICADAYNTTVKIPSDITIDFGNGKEENINWRKENCLYIFQKQISIYGKHSNYFNIEDLRIEVHDSILMILIKLCHGIDNIKKHLD